MTNLNNLLELNSVGSIVDIEKEIAYPQMSNGLPDLDMGVEIEECSDEWWDGVSKEDMDLLMDALYPDSILNWKF